MNLDSRLSSILGKGFKKEFSGWILTLLYPVTLAKVSIKDCQVASWLSFFQYPWQGFQERVFKIESWLFSIRYHWQSSNEGLSDFKKSWLVYPVSLPRVLIKECQIKSWLSLIQYPWQGFEERNVSCFTFTGLFFSQYLRKKVQ